MKKTLTILIILFGLINLKAQTCNEVMETVKAENYGMTYFSYNSDAISKVTFYDVIIDYQYYYFAIVCGSLSIFAKRHFRSLYKQRLYF